jgi:glycosyltransferase involved in cell wall biosynthesis
LELVDLLGDTEVVCNSHQAEMEWGFRNCRTIWHGFSPHDFPEGSKGGGVFCMGERALVTRPHYNGYFVISEVRELLDPQICVRNLEVEDPPHTYPVDTNEWAKVKYENYARALGSHDVYVNATVRSPMPRTRAEAMMCGVVSVSLRNHDVDMFIESGKNGFVADSAEEIADQIQYVMKNPSQRERMAKASRITAMTTFGQDRYLADWSRLMHDLVG